jgi:PAS domain S-box-containing protein
VLGLLMVAAPILFALRWPTAALTRHLIAVGQLLITGLLIHLTGGRIETHFLVFGSLAFLAFFRDWKVLITATLVTAVDHFGRGMLWPESVYGTAWASQWRWLEHAGWVAFEDLFLIISCVRGVSEMRAQCRREAQLEVTSGRAAAAAQALAQSEQRYRFMADAMPQMVWTAGPDGRVDYFNHRWEAYTGPAAGGALRHEFGAIIHPEDLDRCMGEWSRAVEAGAFYEIEIRLCRASDRAYRWHLCRAVPLRDATGAVVQWFGTNTDIEEQKQAQVELRDAKVQAEGASRSPRFWRR